jgi:hypothetical protein
MGFNFPNPPSHTTFPETAQNIANVVMAVLVAAFVAYAVFELVRGRGPLALILLAGGAVAYLNEPMLDVLGPLWHPRPNQDVAIETFGPAPMWGLGIYTAFFGGGTYVLYRRFARGLTLRQFWIGVGGFFAVNLAVEPAARCSARRCCWSRPASSPASGSCSRCWCRCASTARSA